MLQGAQNPKITYPANKRTAKRKTLCLIAKNKTKFNPAKDEFCDKMTYPACRGEGGMCPPLEAESKRR